MDIKLVCESIFERLYPELEIKIKSFEILERQKFCENNKWEKDTPSIFIGVELKEFPSQSSNISQIMTDLTGFEINVFRF